MRPQTQPGMFIPAPPISGAVIFNIADYLARWSNDSLKSTLHRVRAPPARSEDGGWTRERYSIPYVSAGCNVTGCLLRESSSAAPIVTRLLMHYPVHGAFEMLTMVRYSPRL